MHGFDSAQAFLDGMVADSLGCVVLDVRMPGMDGLELQRRLTDCGVEVPSVFLTGHGDIPSRWKRCMRAPDATDHGRG